MPLEDMFHVTGKSKPRKGRDVTNRRSNIKNKTKICSGNVKRSSQGSIKLTSPKLSIQKILKHTSKKDKVHIIHDISGYLKSRIRQLVKNLR